MYALRSFYISHTFPHKTCITKYSMNLKHSRNPTTNHIKFNTLGCIVVGIAYVKTALQTINIPLLAIQINYVRIICIYNYLVRCVLVTVFMSTGYLFQIYAKPWKIILSGNIWDAWYYIEDDGTIIWRKINFQREMDSG